MSVIDEVKQRTDIVEVVGQYTTLTKSGRTFRAVCPFHSEKHPSFFVYPEQQSWHCFGACNTGGDVFSFIMKKQGIDFGEALRLLAERAGVTIPAKSEEGAEGKEREKLYKINEAAARYFNNMLLNSPAAEKARSYVSSRGLSPETIANFQVGFSLSSWEALKQYLAERGYTEDELLAAGLVTEEESGKTHDRFRNRLMFPIHNLKGHIIGFGARALDDSMPKYLNSPQTSIFDKSGSLYGINQAAAAIRQNDMAVIVEGYMDAITAHQNGFKNVVASMGTSITEKQVSTLKKLTKNISLALDADAAGEEAMLRGVGYENILGAEVKTIILPKGKDPDDVIKEDARIWQQLVEEALPILDYTFDMVTSKLDLNTVRDKALARDRLLPIINGIKDVVRQAHYLQKLSRLLNVSERILQADLTRIKTSEIRQSAKKQDQEAGARSLHPFLSSPLEEYCLALLLQHPQLKDKSQELLPEYFENSENHEIFIAWQRAADPSSLEGMLDSTSWEHLDAIINRYKNPRANQLETRYADCVLRLREKYLRSVAAKRAMALAVEAETGGPVAELAKLKEQGIEISIQLGKVFTQKGRRR